MRVLDITATAYDNRVYLHCSGKLLVMQEALSRSWSITRSRLTLKRDHNSPRVFELARTQGTNLRRQKNIIKDSKTDKVTWH